MHCPILDMLKSTTHQLHSYWILLLVMSKLCYNTTALANYRDDAEFRLLSDLVST